MKNATKHAATLKSLHKKLCRQHKPGDRPQLDPLRALVLGVLQEACDDGRAHKAAAALDEEFVDVNELRVATELELTNLIGPGYPAAMDRAVRLREILMHLFDGEGRLTIDRVAAMNKKEQRAHLRAVPAMTPFIEGYVSLLGFGQAAMPVDEAMRRYLAGQGVLEADATLEDAQKFLESNLKADEYWPFFACCRAESCKPRSRGRTGEAKAKKTSKKAAKATTRTGTRRASGRKQSA